jgi:hypothetical protein
MRTWIGDEVWTMNVKAAKHAVKIPKFEDHSLEAKERA